MRRGSAAIPEGGIEMYSKVYYIVYGFFFSLIVAAVLCLCLTIMQGVPHIDPIFFLMSFAVAFVTSFLVTSIIPLARRRRKGVAARIPGDKVAIQAAPPAVDSRGMAGRWRAALPFCVFGSYRIPNSASSCERLLTASFA